MKLTAILSITFLPFLLASLLANSVEAAPTRAFVTRRAIARAVERPAIEAAEAVARRIQASRGK